VISDKSISLFLASIPYNPKDKPSSVSDRVALAFLFAIETGMRAGEICGLTRADITSKVATLKQTKNGKPRKVPLSQEALRILALLDDDLFGMTSQRLDGMFRKLRDAGSFEFRFHDTRHTAVTRLAKKLDVMVLAKVIGHSDPRQLMKYYHPDEESLADLLD
jgi:integrase